MSYVGRRGPKVISKYWRKSAVNTDFIGCIIFHYFFDQIAIFS